MGGQCIAREQDDEQADKGPVQTLTGQASRAQIRQIGHDQHALDGDAHHLPGVAEYRPSSVMALVSTSMKPPPRKKKHSAEGSQAREGSRPRTRKNAVP